MTCDEYQIAFDQLAVGASSTVPAAEVDAHVTTCAACTAYVSLSRKVTARMTNTISASPPPLDIAAMRARVSTFRRRANLWLVIWPVSVFTSLLLLTQVVVPGNTWGTHAVPTAALATVFGWALFAFHTRRQLSRLTAIEVASGDGLVARFRAELDRRVRTERQGWWVLPIVLVGFHWRFVGWALPSGPLLVFELCYIALFPLGIVRYRRAKRERALLG
jgi:hypothetical protein